MKAILTYYSYTGHEERIARYFEEALARRGEVFSQRLKPREEITTFFGQRRAAFTRKKAQLSGDVKLDAGSYDVIVVGCPVWAFAPVPAINTFLDSVNGLFGKKAVIFLTSGSGAGVGKCFKNIRTALEAKGASVVEEVNIPDRRLCDEPFVRSIIDAAVRRAC